MKIVSITINKQFNAPVEMLWKVWTEPKYLSIWFGSVLNGNIISVEIELRVGGRYTIHFMDSEGLSHTAFEIFDEVIPFSKLKCTWEWLSEPEFVSSLQVDFIREMETSKLVLTHSDLNSGAALAYSYGWTGAIDKIETKILNNKPLENSLCRHTDT